MNKYIIKLATGLLANLIVTSASNAQEFCTGISCEPGIVSQYTCSGNTGSGQSQSCSYAPVMKEQCSEQGCYKLPLSSVEECISLGKENCTVRPARLVGRDGPKGSEGRDNSVIHDREYIITCSQKGSSDELILSMSKSNIRVKMGDKVTILFKGLTITQLSPTFTPQLKTFTTYFKDKMGDVVFMVENHNFDTPNGHGFGKLKYFDNSYCHQ